MYLIIEKALLERKKSYIVLVICITVSFMTRSNMPDIVEKRADFQKLP